MRSRTQNSPHRSPVPVTPPRIVVALLGALAVVAAACGASTGTTITGGPPRPDAASGPAASTSGSRPFPPGATPIATSGSALVDTDEGLVSVPIGSSTPTWTAAGGAALDGSAAFTSSSTTGAPGTETTTVIQIDPRTGAQVQCCWGQRGDLRVAAVAPGGRWVALTTRPRARAAAVHGFDAPPPPALQPDQTRLLVLRGQPAGSPVADLVLEGDVEPEAFSPDGSLLYALRHEEGGYRIETIVLATGEQRPTFGRLEQKPVTMHGRGVQSVLNADRTIQATLYLKPQNPEQPAFVHVLDLQNDWAHCADLPATGPGGAVGWDTITITPSGTALVGAAADGKVAEIEIAAVHDPEGKVTVDVRDDPAPPAQPDGLDTVPGFNRLIALVP